MSNNINGENMNKQKQKINNKIDLINDIELATYIDARERYDELLRLSEEDVIDEYEDENLSE